MHNSIIDKNLIVTKACGDTALFSEAKLRNSLQKSGVQNQDIDAIINQVSGKLYNGISTKQIYKQVYGLLKGTSRHLAARYNLKQAIMELGPSGFPFEKYIAELFKHKGYETSVSQFIEGNCLTHEIDVIAQRGNDYLLIECKYHNQLGKVSDVKVPLYIQSRFKDVEGKLLQQAGHQNKQHFGWVITNTRFSSDAIKYGTCIGLNLLGWDFPFHQSLKEQIDSEGLYPITCLTSLTKIEKQILLDKKIVLCKELLENRKLLNHLDIKPSRISLITIEIEKLCKFLA
jgi:hypothetical protein